jgi:hypothetical protein
MLNPTWHTVHKEISQKKDVNILVMKQWPTTREKTGNKMSRIKQPNESGTGDVAQ